jgi:tRNA nucleotidyltransferase (CCA-adding enzyme)
LDSDVNNLADILAGVLPVSLRHVPLRIRDVARELDMEVAVAGGIPRDLIRVATGQLPHDSFAEELKDVDVVVAGENSRHGGAGVRFAFELARRLPGKLTVNDAFHTATLVTGDPLRLDITTARREHYPVPGELPVVDVGDVSIAADLNRRDFTVNALAMNVSSDYGSLIDVCGGVGDIRERNIRVLHSQSFSDDPTRLMRAVRYAVRLGYDMEATTRAQFSSAVDDGVLDHLTPERVRYELECIAREQRWAEMWAILDLANITNALLRNLGGISAHWELEDANALDITLRNQHELLAQENLPPWLVRIAWALRTVEGEFLAQACERLGVFPRQAAFLVNAQGIIQHVMPRMHEELRPSAVCRQLEGYPRVAAALALFISPARDRGDVQARKQLLRYLGEYSHVRSALDGRELLKMGLTPGPLVGQLHDELRYALLDGDISGEDDERSYALEWVERQALAGNGKVDTSFDAEGGEKNEGETP